MPPSGPHLPPDWFEHYQERLAIMTEDGTPPTPGVEAAALSDTLDAMRQAGELPSEVTTSQT